MLKVKFRNRPSQAFWFTFRSFMLAVPVSVKVLTEGPDPVAASEVAVTGRHGDCNVGKCEPGGCTSAHPTCRTA